ncbi:MAG: hypothetical protein ACTHMY_25610 [Solirubrobacteraceae bacterium]
MISRVLRLTAFACCALVVASFAMFARDQMAGASQHQQTALVAGAHPTAASSTPVKHAQPRRTIDEAAKVLTTPFDEIVQSSNLWVKHGLPALFAVLVYGMGLGYVARFSAART